MPHAVRSPSAQHSVRVDARENRHGSRSSDPLPSAQSAFLVIPHRMRWPCLRPFRSAELDDQLASAAASHYYTYISGDRQRANRFQLPVMLAAARR